MSRPGIVEGADAGEAGYRKVAQLGWVPMKESVIQWRRYHHDELVFDVTYTIGDRGLRVSAPIRRWGKELPEAVAVLDNGFHAATQFYAFPKAHWTCLRTTNGLERLQREVKRGIKATGAFPDRASALRLVTAVALKATSVVATPGGERVNALEVREHEPSVGGVLEQIADVETLQRAHHRTAEEALGRCAP